MRDVALVTVCLSACDEVGFSGDMGSIFFDPEPKAALSKRSVMFTLFGLMPTLVHFREVFGLCDERHESSAKESMKGSLTTWPFVCVEVN